MMTDIKRLKLVRSRVDVTFTVKYMNDIISRNSDNPSNTRLNTKKFVNFIR